MSHSFSKSQRVMVTGAGGMLGSALMEVLPRYGSCVGFSGKTQPPRRNNGDWYQGSLLDFSKLRDAVSEIRPTAIVHTASSVSVNECEKPENREATYRLHVGVTAALVEAAAHVGAHMIYISTESVYDGRKEGLYLESDNTNPLNYYAQTKLEGETPVLRYAKGTVLRTNLFGWRTDGILSFGEWVLAGLEKREKRTMFTDVTFTPLSSIALAETIQGVLRAQPEGLFHAGGKDVISKYDFGIRVAKALGLSNDVLVPVTIDSVAMGAARPKNTALDSSRLASALGESRPSIDESIDQWIANRPTNRK